MSFVTEYRRLLDTAFASGWRSAPLRLNGRGQPREDPVAARRFLAACHRGFEKAQDQVCESLEALLGDDTISPEEQVRREFLYRRVVDGIAYGYLFQQRSHVARRFVLEPKPKRIDIVASRKSLDAANLYNNKSRQTFALVTDLTTFIQIADLVCVDHRPDPPTVRLVELKSGSVNQMLLTELDKYSPEPGSLDQLRNDKSIRAKHLRQAERILKQKIRLHQVTKSINTDEGLDISLSKTIKLVGPEIEIEDYDSVLEEICANASNIPTVAIDDCLHLVSVFHPDPKRAKRLAASAMSALVDQIIADSEVNEIRRELSAAIPARNTFVGGDLFERNLYSGPARPFTFWSIKNEHTDSLVAGSLRVMFLFDLAGFIKLGRDAGLNVGLSTRREAAQLLKNKQGRTMMPLWGDRLVRVPTADDAVYLSYGMLCRITDDLALPEIVIKIYKRLVREAE